MNDNCSKHDVDEHLVIIIRTTVTTCSIQYHDNHRKNITAISRSQPKNNHHHNKRGNEKKNTTTGTFTTSTENTTIKATIMDCWRHQTNQGHIQRRGATSNLSTPFETHNDP